jgi:hypothetical protein
METIETDPGNQGAMICGRPHWVLTIPYALLLTLLVCLPVWPGQMGYDALYAYRSSIEGIDTAVWPPMHAYLFWISRAAGLGVGGLFAAQTFMIFMGVALSAALLIRSRRLLLFALVGFALMTALVAPILGVMLVHWRDVTTASFAMTSLALWLLAARFRSTACLILAALALGLSVSLRYNAFALFAGVVPLMLWKPFLNRRVPAWVRGVTVAALALSIGLAWASVQWRLPDFKRLPPAGTFTNVQVFDLLGVSACDGRNYLPLAVTRGTALTVDQVRRLYDPRHVQLSFGPHPGIPQLYATRKFQTPQMRADVAQAWRGVVRQHFGCYFKHRNAVARVQLGLTSDEVFYPTHGQIDDNPYGLGLAHPKASQAVTAYVWQGARGWWSRPALLCMITVLVLLALARRRDPRALVAAALFCGVLGNEALLYLIAPEADARYLLPSNVFCALIVAAGLAMLAEGPGAQVAQVAQFEVRSPAKTQREEPT